MGHVRRCRAAGAAPLWSVETVAAADGSRQAGRAGERFPAVAARRRTCSRAGGRRPHGQRRCSTNRRCRVGVRLRRRDRRPQRARAVSARSGRACTRAALGRRATAAGVSAAWAHDRRGTLKRQHGPRQQARDSVGHARTGGAEAAGRPGDAAAPPPADGVLAAHPGVRARQRGQVPRSQLAGEELDHQPDEAARGAAGPRARDAFIDDAQRGLRRARRCASACRRTCCR